MEKKKVLFIDRDGTLILETDDFKIEKFEKLIFYPNVFQYLGRIARELNYELVMVTNQDGLGTEAFPEKDFWEVQKFIVQTFDNEEIHFEKVFIDKSCTAAGNINVLSDQITVHLGNKILKIKVNVFHRSSSTSIFINISRNQHVLVKRAFNNMIIFY